MTSRPGPDAVRAAYRHCEQITGSQARNFSYGIQLLPAAKRQALSAVYAFARRIDDIGDGDLPAASRSSPRWPRPGRGARPWPARAADPGDDPVLIALARRGGPVPDPAGRVRRADRRLRGRRPRAPATPRSATCEHYCRCVAGSIGRLSLGVFGCADPQLPRRWPTRSGVALQLTNILRDIREDYGTGRVYLPAEDLKQFGCTLVAGGTELPSDDRLHEVIRFEADRARGWYATGLALLPLLDRRSAASAGAMAGIYRRLLERIAAQPAAVLQQPAVADRQREGHGRGHGPWPAMTRPATRDGRRGECRNERAPARRRASAAAWPASPPRSRCARPAPRSRCSRPGPGWAARPPRSAAAADHRQRPARVPALLHRLPGAARPARHERRRRRCRTGSTSPCWPRGGRARLRRTQLPGPAAHGPGAGHVPAPLARRAAAGRPGRAGHAVPEPGGPGHSTSSALVTGWPRTGRASTRAARCGTCSPCPR